MAFVLFKHFSIIECVLRRRVMFSFYSIYFLIKYHFLYSKPPYGASLDVNTKESCLQNSPAFNNNRNKTVKFLPTKVSDWRAQGIFGAYTLPLQKQVQIQSTSWISLRLENVRILSLFVAYWLTDYRWNCAPMRGIVG